MLKRQKQHIERKDSFVYEPKYKDRGSKLSGTVVLLPTLTVQPSTVGVGGFLHKWAFTDTTTIIMRIKIIFKYCFIRLYIFLDSLP